jgi:hypothetical protein
LTLLGLIAFPTAVAAAALSDRIDLGIFDQPQRQEAVPEAMSNRVRTFLSLVEVKAALQASQLDRPIQSLLNTSGRMRYGDFIWNDQGVPAGRIWIRVDLDAQLVSVFRAGHEIGTAVILYGADEKETPEGKFPILAKLKDHRSSLYDAEMPYTLRLTGDGVAIHGSDVKWGAATHGCIGVPVEFARKLFAQAATGDEVTILSRRQREGRQEA